MAEVEEVLDSCHALMDYGVDRYKRPQPQSAKEKEARRARSRSTSGASSTICGARCRRRRPRRPPPRAAVFPAEPEENILYFVEKHSPRLAPWQRELVRIVRKLAQYFYPQTQTKVMNEGWATFWHYTLINRLYEKKTRGRRLHAGVPAHPHQCGHAARLRPAGLPRHEPVRAGLRHDAGHPADLREARPRKTPLGFPSWPVPTGASRWISRCATSRTNPSSRSTCRRA